MSDEEPFMSSDGSDSEGSLAEFILGSEDEEGEVVNLPDDDPENEAVALAQELSPEERALMEEKTSSGPRRSRRARKAPVRYVDDKYAELMLTKGGAADLEEVLAPSSDEEAAESDGDFEASDDELSTDDEEADEDEEDQSSSKRSRDEQEERADDDEPASKQRRTDATVAEE